MTSSKLCTEPARTAPEVKVRIVKPQTYQLPLCGRAAEAGIRDVCDAPRCIGRHAALEHFGFESVGANVRIGVWGRYGRQKALAAGPNTNRQSVPSSILIVPEPVSPFASRTEVPKPF